MTCRGLLERYLLMTMSRTRSLLRIQYRCWSWRKLTRIGVPRGFLQISNQSLRRILQSGIISHHQCEDLWVDCILFRNGNSPIWHGVVGVSLERIGAVETAECWWCGQAEQSVVHLYVKCRKWRKERRVLKRELRGLGIEWQRRPEKRWLVSRFHGWPQPC